MTTPTILAVLDISTAHLTVETRDRLDEDPETWPVSGGAIPFGYFIYAHDEDCDGSIPPDLWACIEFARKHGCSHLRFDADADAYADLPTWDSDGNPED